MPFDLVGHHFDTHILSLLPFPEKFAPIHLNVRYPCVNHFSLYIQCKICYFTTGLGIYPVTCEQGKMLSV